MALYNEVHGMSSQGRKSRFGFKAYVYALIAGLLVLVWITHSRGGASGILPSSSLPQNKDPSSLSGGNGPAADTEAETAAGGKTTTTSTTNKKPSESESETLTDEVSLDVYPPAKSTISPLSTPSPISSSSGKGSTSGSSGGSAGSNSGAGTGTGTTTAADRPQAVIIESDVVPNLIPLMLHFATVLGPAWGMILFTMQDRWVEPLSPPFQRLLAEGRIEIRFLPADTVLTSSTAVSQFLTSPWIWEQLEAAQRILLFQSDSILCSKSQARVEDYFEYDLVGAPISSVYGSGYNGGLSIRNPRLFLQVVRETDFSTSGQQFEDQFFYDELRKRGASMPREDVAKTFSVETIYYETPLGYHQPQRWQAQHMAAIEEWCPEVKMLIGRRAE